MPPTDLLERERVADVRFGIYLTVREMELAARALERGGPPPDIASPPTLAQRTLAARLREKAHQVRSLS
jgi:hypothetical protein